MKFVIQKVTFILICLIVLQMSLPSVVFSIESFPFSRQNIKLLPKSTEEFTFANPNEDVTVIVVLREQVDLQKISGQIRSIRLRNTVLHLQWVAERSQKSVISLLDQNKIAGEIINIVPFWIFNGFSITTSPRLVKVLAESSEVAFIYEDAVAIIPTSNGLTSIEPNLSLIRAPSLWNEGWRGQGVVVASMDTGVDIVHPELSDRWRGGENSWYDPYEEHGYPTDFSAENSGHGTQIMGVILGGEESGSAIGVAPEAQWIAVKIFDDNGNATATKIHSGFQWLLDPDNDPMTDDAPHIVNNSWSFSTPGCNIIFQPDLAALRAAGIIPVFSGGNYGPDPDTSVSPANYPEAFAVGAVNNEDVILGLSGRGPSACSEGEDIYPDVTAPGYDVFTTDLSGFYSSSTGTSLSAAHASGAFALLLSVFPSAEIDVLEGALRNSAKDLGSPGADNIYGYGRIDVWSAYQTILDGGNLPTSTPSPETSATPTLTQTPTATPEPSPTPKPYLTDYFFPIFFD